MVRKYTAQKPMEVIPEGAKAWPEMMSQEAGAMARFGMTVMSAAQKWQEKRDTLEISKIQSATNDFHFTLMRQLENDWLSGKFKTTEDFEQVETDYEKAREKFIKNKLKGKRGRISDSVRDYTDQTKTHQGREFFNSLYRKETEFQSVEIEKEVAGAIRRGNSEEAIKIIGLGERWLGLAKAQQMRELVPIQIESNRIQSLINIDPESAMKEIDALDVSMFDEGEKNQLRSQARSAIARNQREQATQFQLMREQTMTAMLADFWDGKLKDPQIITDAFRAGYLDDTDAKYLRNAMLNPDPPETTNEALIAMRYAIDGIGQGTETREGALKKVIAYTEQLNPTDGKAFIKEIFGEHDTKNAFWNRQAQEYMEKQIMEVASMTGILYGSGQQLALSAQALMAYDEAKKTAIADEKPLNGRELLELAHEVMLPFRKQVEPLMPGAKQKGKVPETLGGRKVSPEYKPPLLPKKPPSEQKAADEFAVDKYPKPKTVAEFENTFRHISDKEQRKRYYDKWAEEVYK